MRTMRTLAVVLIIMSAGATEAARAADAKLGFPTSPVAKCAPDAVLAGTACLDRYEASVWRVPHPTTTNAPLVRKIRQGKATRADLTAGGATQLGLQEDDYAPCADNGVGCADDIYAASLPSEIPSAFIDWFQAQEACANAGKRLPTSAEWQVGAYGTPDPGPDNGTTDCNTLTAGEATPTGARSSCVSARGAFDMAGNLLEWVADWVAFPSMCPGWPQGFSDDDQMCLSGASTTAPFPGALLRGGWFADSAQAGPLTLTAFPPFRSTGFVGLRCVR